MFLYGEFLVSINDGDYVAANIDGVYYQINAFEYLNKHCPDLIKVYQDCYSFGHDDADLFFNGTWLINNFSNYFLKRLLVTYGHQITLNDLERNYDV